MQVHPATENRGEFLLEIEEGEPRNVSGLELHEHVHVAFRPEVVAEHRPEEREPAYVISLAEGGHGGLIDADSRTHATNLPGGLDRCQLPRLTRHGRPPARCEASPWASASRGWRGRP